MYTNIHIIYALYIVSSSFIRTNERYSRPDPSSRGFRPTAPTAGRPPPGDGWCRIGRNQKSLRIAPPKADKKEQKRKTSGSRLNLEGTIVGILDGIYIYVYVYIYVYIYTYFYYVYIYIHTHIQFDIWVCLIIGYTVLSGGTAFSDKPGYVMNAPSPKFSTIPVIHWTLRLRHVRVLGTLRCRQTWLAGKSTIYN